MSQPGGFGGRRPLQTSDGLLAASAVLLAIYFGAPNDLSGGGFITHRLNLSPLPRSDPLVRDLPTSGKVEEGIVSAAAVLAVAF